MTSVYPNGVPDLLILRKDLVAFVEVKRPGGKVSLIQKEMYNEIKRQGFNVYVVDSLAQVKQLFQ